MPDYWCFECGGRTAMMGHSKHNEKTLNVLARLQELYPTAKRSDLIDIIGKWQIGEISLPEEQP